MKIKSYLSLVFGAVLLLCSALVFAESPQLSPGLEYIARANAGTNSTAYLANLKVELETQGLQRMQDELYSVGNARSRTLATVHPRTRAAILYLLQLDGWVPDGSGTPPPAFDPSVADSRIDQLGTAIPRQ